jgi:hypothetical protein
MSCNEQHRDWLAARSPLKLGAMLLALTLCACSNEPEPQRLPTASITLGGKSIAVEVADTEETRQIGMMYRRKIGPDEGMLFVFPEIQPLAFYMRNTYVPLSIAFIRSNGEIVNIAHMEPLSLVSHRSRLPCRYALEMPEGWFERNGVKEGSFVVLDKY